MKKKIFKNVSLFIIAFSLGFLVNEYRHVMLKVDKVMTLVGESVVASGEAVTAVGKSLNGFSEISDALSGGKSDTIQNVQEGSISD